MNFLGGTLIAYFCGGLFALLLGGLGVYLIIHSQRSKQKAAMSQTWPMVKGIVTETNITAQEHDEVVRYMPLVRYTYEVDGKIYESRQITFGSGVEFSSRQKAADYLAEYPLDAEVSVYYDPEKPSEAVLKQVAHKTTVGLVIGIVLVVITLCMVCLMTTGIVRLVTNAIQSLAKNGCANCQRSIFFLGSVCGSVWMN